jgi:hypothetical protein
VLKVDHRKFISSLIQGQIDEIDAEDSTDIVVEVSASSQPLLSTVQGVLSQGRVLKDGHVSLHAQQPPTTFGSLEDTFQTTLASWLTTELAANNIPLPGPVRFSPGDQVRVVHL